MAELNATNNAVVRSYTWGLDLSGSEQGAGGVGGLLAMNSGTNGVHFLAYDGNGNVVGLVKATDGTVSANYEYDPFGQTIRLSGPMAKDNPWRFSTKRVDNETDLVWYEYRAYNPSTGRWLCRDQVAEVGGINLYGFVKNNPQRSFDFRGLWGRSLHMNATFSWAYGFSFDLHYSATIGEADERVDHGRMRSWPWPFTDIDRHMLYFRDGVDSRLWWYETVEGVKPYSEALGQARIGPCGGTAQDYGLTPLTHRRGRRPDRIAQDVKGAPISVSGQAGRSRGVKQPSSC